MYSKVCDIPFLVSYYVVQNVNIIHLSKQSFLFLFYGKDKMSKQNNRQITILNRVCIVIVKEVTWSASYSDVKLSKWY